MNPDISELKKNIIETGALLWQKDLAHGLNGNISVRVDADTILLTAHGTSLGRLSPQDILLMKLDGTMLESGRVSTEKTLHTEIYKHLPDAQAVVHTHTTFTNGYFCAHDDLEPKIFETRFVLGHVRAIPQSGPSVTDAMPVVEALKKNNISVLKNHGVVAVGKSLFDGFLLIQALEEAVKVDVVSRIYSGYDRGAEDQKGRAEGTPPVAKGQTAATSGHKGYKLFSQEQIDEIVKVVNADAQMADLGEKTKMVMDLAVQLNETGQVHSFSFQNGRIVKVGQDAQAEFLISASEAVWRAVFKREIDPFVATTQKKMNLRGDFARISKWYAPCSRIFELWQRVPVE